MLFRSARVCSALNPTASTSFVIIHITGEPNASNIFTRTYQNPNHLPRHHPRPRHLLNNHTVHHTLDSNVFVCVLCVCVCVTVVNCYLVLTFLKTDMLSYPVASH